MTTTTKTTVMRRFALAIATLGLSCCLGALGAPGAALALETPEYTPGESYYIDEPEAFRDQDVEHERADQMSASTQYWVTSAFYLHWISPDQIIYEGEEAYIGCEAVGLEDVSYEWKVSRDGGKTFADDTLLGNEHVIDGLEANDPETEPYLFRCTVTNGDGTATLTADVHIVVLDVADPASEDGGSPAYDPDGKSGKSGGKRIPQLGDEQLAGLAAVAGAGLFASLALLLALMRPKKREEEEQPAE